MHDQDANQDHDHRSGPESDRTPDHPGVIAPPPLIYLGALMLAVLLEWRWSAPLFMHPVVPVAGAVLFVLGVAMILWGFRSMARARTPVSPYRRVTEIVDTGAFRVSRNPLYVGLDAIFLGTTLLLNTWWGILMLVPALIVMHYGVIRREERYLEREFGQRYRHYRSKVRRYL